jgi:DNA (cytosine-5)-methyltransferase 1
MESGKKFAAKRKGVTAAPARIALSLFSGAGGDTKGLEAAGWKVTHFSEFNPAAIRTHETAFPGSAHLTAPDGSADIRNIPNSSFEKFRGQVGLLFNGAPCQGYSHAGKKKSDDPRNELIHESLRVAKVVQPKWILTENVKGLLARKGVYPAGSEPRPVIDILRERFEEAGYRITYNVIDTTQVGVPQQRKRVVIVAHRGDLYPHIPWDSLVAPSPAPSIRGVLETTLEGAVRLPDLYKPAEQPARFWIQTSETEPTGTPHPNLVRLVEGKRNLSTKEKREKKMDEKAKVLYTEPAGLISFGVRKGGYHGQVLDPDAPSKTIICAYNQCPRLFVGLHNPATGAYWVRCLTVRECGQIQGFPADYPWQGVTKDKITQIGNAVPPPLATAVAGLLERATFAAEPQACSGGAAVVSTGSDSESEDEE